MAVLELQTQNEIVTYASSAFTKERVMQVFQQYRFQLINDGFTAFGLASRSFEVFLDDHKLFRAYCNDLGHVKRILNDLGVPETTKLNLLASAPHYHSDLGASFNGELARFAEPLPKEELERFQKDPTAYNRFKQDIIARLEMGVQSRRGYS